MSSSVMRRLHSSCYQQLLESLHDGLYFVDADRVITYWNKAAERITGFSAEEVVGRTCADGILTGIDGTGRNLCTGGCPLAETISDGRTRESTLFLHHKDGHRVEVALSVFPLRNEAGEIEGGIELFSDLSKPEAALERLNVLDQVAYLDSQTLLVNHHYVVRELAQRLEEYNCFKIPFAVLVMDIDQLRAINEQLGRDVGDDVLAFVANTFSTNSGPFDLYGRWDSNEFLGVIRNISRSELETLAERLRMLVEKAYILREEQRVSVTLSVGATMVNRYDTLEGLLARGEQAKKQSKKQGGNCVTIS